MTDVNEIARAILDGFNKHYWLFRETSARAKHRFENADWAAAAEAGRARIHMYDQRVEEAVDTLQSRFPSSKHEGTLWAKIKIAYIGLLHEHKQPECAETFYNSVACRVLDRQYYHNKYIFWRPAISTEHLEGEEPTYRCYYPRERGLRRCMLELLLDFQLENPFENLRRDLRALMDAFQQDRSDALQINPNHQLQVLGSLFFRNKGAYVVGREINGNDQRPFVIPILRNERGEIYLDAFLRDIGDIAILFSFSRAYFMVDLEVPSAYVTFLHAVLPRKPVQELYSMLGLHKQSKTIFYRNLDHHLKYSTDKFMIAPGIKGMVMLVFTLPSFPFVFKVIKDVFEPPKEGDKELVKDRYLLVKHHDRVGRLADTLEYSYVALPRHRMEQELIEELERKAPTNIEISGDRVLIKHVYIERRMIPLNDYMGKASERQRWHAVREYGDAIRDLAGANIFPGDMMLKNFGVTRHNRVVFYDYDEICYMTECNFRHIPPAPPGYDDLSSEPWYSVGPNDVFPEQFAAFFFSDAETRRVFYKDHRCLINADYWNDIKRQIQEGKQIDVFPYPESVRFSVGYSSPPLLGAAAREESSIDCE